VLLDCFSQLLCECAAFPYAGGPVGGSPVLDPNCRISAGVRVVLAGVLVMPVVTAVMSCGLRFTGLLVPVFRGAALGFLVTDVECMSGAKLEEWRILGVCPAGGGWCGGVPLLCSGRNSVGSSSGAALCIFCS
jgi:hypothetical protein